MLNFGGIVDGSEIRRENQLRLVVYPIIYRVDDTSQVVQDFWTINSITSIEGKIWYLQECIQMTRLLVMFLYTAHVGQTWGGVTLIKKWLKIPAWEKNCCFNWKSFLSTNLPTFLHSDFVLGQRRRKVKADSIGRINPKQGARTIEWVLKCSIFADHGT